jgi:deoxyadenosine/deoxycytidine kinase
MSASDIEEKASGVDGDAQTRLLREVRDDAASRDAAPYRTVAREFALTLMMLDEKTIAFEGVPAVGKTTLMHSVASALEQYGLRVVRHEEDRHQEMLDEFFKDPECYAFWFQTFKQLVRKGLCAELELPSREAATHLLDRTLPGDLAFALYQYLKGRFTKSQFAAYFKNLVQVKYRPPLLTLYLTADPDTLVARVAQRGFDDEVKFYDRQYFVDMDACYRTALDISGCSYCVVNWDEHMAEVAAHHSVAQKPLVAAKRCMHLLETALIATYPENVTRLGAQVAPPPGMGIDAGSILYSGSGKLMTGRDPAELAREAEQLLLSRSGEMQRKFSDGHDAELARSMRVATTPVQAAALGASGDAPPSDPALVSRFHDTLVDISSVALALDPYQVLWDDAHPRSIGPIHDHSDLPTGDEFDDMPELTSGTPMGVGPMDA